MPVKLYHVNDEGNAGVCTASKGRCPFGGESEHFTSEEAARESYENRQEKKAASVKAWKRKPVPAKPKPMNEPPVYVGHGRSYGGHGAPAPTAPKPAVERPTYLGHGRFSGGSHGH